MQDKALEFEKLRGNQRLSEISANADAAWNVGAISNRPDLNPGERLMRISGSTPVRAYR